MPARFPDKGLPRSVSAVASVPGLLCLDAPMVAGLGRRSGRFANQNSMSFSRKASDLRWDGLTAPTRMANAADVRSRLCKRVASVQLVELFGAVYSQLRTVHARVDVRVDGRFLSAERRPAAVEGYAAESGGRVVDKLMVVGAMYARWRRSLRRARSTLRMEVEIGRRIGREQDVDGGDQRAGSLMADGGW